MASTLQVDDLAIERGSAVLADDLSFVLAPGQVLAVVGPNGCGKSTLLEVLAGRLEPTGGRVSVNPPGIVGLVTQGRQYEPDMSLREATAWDTGIAQAAEALARATEQLGAGDLSPASAEDYDLALQTWLRLGGADFTERLAQALATVGLAVNPHVAVGTLSGGQLARLQLVGILISRFDVLLLDEPTNDLDRAGLARLRDFVVSTEAPMLLVSHDRQFLADVATDVLEFDPALETVTHFAGGYEAWRVDRDRLRMAAEAGYQDQEAERARLLGEADAARRRADRGAATARRKYASGRVDRVSKGAMLDGATAGASSAQRARKAAERLDAKRQPRKQWELRLSFPGAVGGSGALVDLQDAAFARGDYRLGPIRAQVHAGERILLSGSNGTGKSTLLKLMVGKLAPSSGAVLTPPARDFGYLDQARDLGSEGTLLDWGRETLPDLPLAELRSLLAKFGLGSEDLPKRLAELSWGERTRARLATLSVRQTRMLVLDEPTNHLDLGAVEQLEVGVNAYPGAVVLVTHDADLHAAFTADRFWRLERTVSGAVRFFDSVAESSIR